MLRCSMSSKGLTAKPKMAAGNVAKSMVIIRLRYNIFTFMQRPHMGSRDWD